MTNLGRALPVGLFLVFSLLCALIGLEITSPTQEQHYDATAATAAPLEINAPEATRLTDQHDAWFREILARPLFSPDRKPVGASVRSVAGLPRLTGIVVSGSRHIAIFAASAGGRPVVVEAGSHVGAYEVTDITDGAVTVAGPEGTTVVRPIFDAAAATVVKPTVTGRPELPKPMPK